MLIGAALHHRLSRGGNDARSPEFSRRMWPFPLGSYRDKTRVALAGKVAKSQDLNLMFQGLDILGS